jgi:tRNA A37 methylthiotransferase MiaB
MSAPLGAPGGSGSRGKVYLETYGCQMNANDSEVVLSVLTDAGYGVTQDVGLADVVLLNTCAIREKAEQRVWQRLAYFRSLRRPGARRSARVESGGVAGLLSGPSPGGVAPVGEGVVVGVLGCMAERLKSQLLEADRLADLVAGPDAYRDLPRLIDAVSGTGCKEMNVQLSAEETYGDIMPVRPDGTKSAFVTIMRGCNNACAFCIVPYTRGQERSRDPASIEYEVRVLSEAGVKEVTLLGQNVNSYAYLPPETDSDVPAAAAAAAEQGLHAAVAALETTADFSALLQNSSSSASEAAQLYAPGFSTRYDPTKRRAGAVRFAQLLDTVAAIDPEMRIRFTSPHPKDFPDEVLRVIASRPNVCACLHMPAQSGSDSVLQRMARGYTQAAYLQLVARARALVPGVEFTSDFISGFCGETEEEHADTVALVGEVGYTQAFMFAYSQRAGTAAARHMVDDIPEEVKQRRLAEVIDTFRRTAAQRNQEEVGRVHCVLVDGPSKKSDADLAGKTDTGKVVVFPDTAVPEAYSPHGRPAGGATVRLLPGDYVAVRVDKATTGTLMGVALGRTTLMGFQALHGAQWSSSVAVAR